MCKVTGILLVASPFQVKAAMVEVKSEMDNFKYNSG